MQRWMTSVPVPQDTVIRCSKNGGCPDVDVLHAPDAG